MDRQRLVVAAAAAVAVAVKGGTSVARAATGPWNWFTGDERASIAGYSGDDSLRIAARRDVNVEALHIRLVGRDGNFEFEHDAKVPASTLNAYIAGTPTRTPITIGGWDAQDLVSLIVGGTAGQKSDIQQWRVANRTVAAIDADGGLRLGPITLAGAVEGGRAVVFATLPDGTRQVLAGGGAAAAAAAGTAPAAKPAATGGATRSTAAGR